MLGVRCRDVGPTSPLTATVIVFTIHPAQRGISSNSQVCPVCKVTAPLFLHHPCYLAASQLDILHSRWRNLQKLTFADGMAPCWRDTTLVICLGFSRWSFPTLSLSRLLFDQTSTMRTFEGFFTSNTPHLTPALSFNFDAPGQTRAPQELPRPFPEQQSCPPMDADTTDASPEPQ